MNQIKNQISGTVIELYKEIKNSYRSINLKLNTMKTKIIYSAIFLTLFTTISIAQDRTIINANNSEISDNLDLRAVASLFGDARNLEDFERQLNDPKIQISNLDLNNDNQVDYLRVIESVEKNTHLIIIQSVLGQDMFQDVATIEVERDRNNKIQIQVVGDVYMYGDNYIYEPVYVHTPVIYSSFWVRNYRPYYSSWYWNYYPSYYYVWNPFPIFRYRNNINVYINFSNQYNYVTHRSCHRAMFIHHTVRQNYCERNYPNRSFSQRNRNVANRYELDQNRSYRNVNSRNELAYNNPRVLNNRTYSRTNPTEYNTNNGKRESVNERTYATTTRERNIPENSNKGRVFSNSETNRSNQPSYERSNTNTTREVNRRNDNKPSENYSQNRTESPRTYSETRGSSHRENQQIRNVTPQGNRGNSSARR
jgi:hypothetical protein